VSPYGRAPPPVTQGRSCRGRSPIAPRRSVRGCRRVWEAGDGARGRQRDAAGALSPATQRLRSCGAFAARRGRQVNAFTSRRSRGGARRPSCSPRKHSSISPLGAQKFASESDFHRPEKNHSLHFSIFCVFTQARLFTSILTCGEDFRFTSSTALRDCLLVAPGARVLF
jgi:hypothetical protein